MTRRIEVIIIRESLWQSIVSDAVTVASVAGLIGLGWLLDSGAMQWFGFLMAAVLTVARSQGHRRHTVDSAIAHLEQIRRAAE